ncbi:MAG: NAD(P)-binding protein, partial [Acidimicrobiia bacterium]|nr:NAD(P)-binding protein [Acidimicrobiia bacterium]
MEHVAVIGAGWTGAVVARLLADAGCSVEIFERSSVVGGHSRAEVLDGVVYEPNGAHIFHTSNPVVQRFVDRFGLSRPYEHCVVTEVHLDDTDAPIMLSWPPQVSELEQLPVWPTVERELAGLPERPHGQNFEDYVVSMMGRTLYGLFIRGYTEKQWGRDPRELSWRFAPKRVELRRDGYRRLFRDRWEFFAPDGVNPVIEAIVGDIGCHFETTVDLATAVDLSRRFDRLIVTAPLDELAGCSGELEWRGIEMHSRFIPTAEPNMTVTPAYVVNRPSHRVPYTRTVETKHASGQHVMGTVVSEEHPGAPRRHYPVPTVSGENERRNAELQQQIASAVDCPVDYAGRLATYRYIDQDQAIEDAMSTA